MTRSCHLAVVGGSGSGKSWLAGKLMDHFSPLAGSVSLDNFYRDLSHLGSAERERVNFDEPTAIDWGAVGTFLETLELKRTATLPGYDFGTHTRRGQGTPFEPRPVMIWDGLWLLGPDWLRERFCWSVFVECPAEERLRRRVRRDGLERDRSEASVKAQFHRVVNPMHGLHVEPQRAHAMMKVVSPPGEEGLERLLASAKRRVSEVLGEDFALRRRVA